MTQQLNDNADGSLFDEHPPPPPEDHYSPPVDWDAPPPVEVSFTVDHAGPSHYGAEFPPDRPGYQQPTGNEHLAARIVTTVRDCLAATHGRYGDEVVDLVRYMLGSDLVMDQLDKDQVRTFKRVGEVLSSVALDNPEGEFDLFDIPDLESATAKVVNEVNKLRAIAKLEAAVTNPTSTWRALCDQVQRQACADGARSLIEAIGEDLPADELMKAFTGLEPPTTVKTVVNASFSRTAGEWMKADAEAAAARPAYGISSGYRTLDLVLTLKDAQGRPAEAIAAWRPGEFIGIAAATGNGKSALARPLVTAAAEDLVHGWGHEHAKVLIAITEEAPSIVYRAAGLGEGQPFHHLKDNVVIADVGASRRRFVHAVWDCVIDAYHLSKATGKPIVDCGMPEAIFLDYIGGIVEAGEGVDTTAIENTANLIMRGLCGWRVQEMEQFSGESFSAYAGMSWPAGMEDFRPAVITFIQTRKLQKAEFYDPKTGNVADFTVEKADGSAGWEVRPGDFIIPQRSDVRGSGILQNHLTTLIVAHRSRPQNNGKVLDKETGKLRLEDDRARLIFHKTRNSSDTPFVPMRFDSNYEGLRGAFYDLMAEQAIEQGIIKPLPSYVHPGSPILPDRPTRSPFAGIAY